MRGIVGPAPVEQAKDQVGGAVVDLDPDPAGAAGVGVEVDVSEGFVDAGEEAGGVEIAEAGVAGPFFGQDA